MSRSWMALALFLATTLPAQTAPDVKGSADLPWLGRYAGARIIGYEQQAFDVGQFLKRALVGATRDTAAFLSVEGKRTRLTYELPAGRSSLEVFRNYQQRLTGDGFTAVYTCEATQCGDAPLRLARFAFDDAMANALSFAAGFGRAPRYATFRKRSGADEQVVALFVGESPAGGVRVLVQAVERTAMETGKIVVPTAGEMRDAISASGRVSLYGIFFDTNEASIKPESRPTLDQIAALLRADPALNVIVVGHTDNQGDFQANIRLSERRAAAVVSALVTDAKIAPTRLTAFGAGMSAPAATNADEPGRARNRRVELVRR